MLTLLAKLLHALNSESSPRQIAAAIALGLCVGITPLLSLHNLLFLLLAFLIRINLSAFFLSATVFSAVGLLLAPISISLGEALLTAPSLQGLWTSLYQFNIYKLAHLHHTLTLGSLLVGLILFVPCMLASQQIVIRYRVHIKAFIEKFKVVQWLKSSKFYQIYQTVTGG
ncbi:DUF2062 domain-containing protein [Saccharobesus litoralis]|uniref:DUF2062 domain-containing protein n=1 Tax=Saccharobesus litoralis TaxID=2172099 RepID=A0A2S0VP06_9ALTE|nr:TIGR03546 family protein [Saccharobesus litoralis]AWB65820.1 DUF2062 domain-containing protein [Saccharobesus litoralis]